MFYLSSLAANINQQFYKKLKTKIYPCLRYDKFYTQQKQIMMFVETYHDGSQKGACALHISIITLCETTTAVWIRVDNIYINLRNML